jgi:ligand-binding sensor domain-containing protein
LWACGDHGGIAVYQNEHWNAVSEQLADPTRTANPRWRSAFADSFGTVYFGSADGLVLWLQDTIVGEIRLPRELPSGYVESITVDSTGAAYVLNGSYLVRVADSLDTLSLEHPSPVVVAVAQSPEGEIWTATRWGVYRLEGTHYVEFPAPLSEPIPVISAIGFDTGGSLWLGTQAGNAHRFDGEIWMRMGDADELGIGPIRDFESDNRQRLWMTGENGGLAVIGQGRLTSFGTAAFGDKRVEAIRIAPNGVPVAATEDGIWGYGNDGVWKPVELFKSMDKNELPDPGGLWQTDAPAISAIEFDSTGRLYVGTADGLALVDESGTRWFTYQDGLGGRAVSALLVDDGGALWIGFRRDGLTHIPLSALW